MNLLQEIICAVWGCNTKVYFTRIKNKQLSFTTYFCRCYSTMCGANGPQRKTEQEAEAAIFERVK